MAGLSAWIWLAVAVAFVAGEALAPGAVLIWFGVAAALVAALEISPVGYALEPDLTQQVAVFAFVSGALLLAGRPLLRRWYGREREDREVEVGVDPNDALTLLIGRTGTLTTPLADGRGRLRLGDGEWPVTAQHDLPAGTRVRVAALRGTTLMVEPCEEETAVEA